MRGSDARTGELFSYVDIEERVPAKHPLRLIRTHRQRGSCCTRQRIRGAVRRHGRPSIAPERLLRALLLQAFYSVRSERQLMEQLNYNLLYRWFVGLGVDDAVWVPTVFTKNRDRLLDAEVAPSSSQPFCSSQGRALLSDEHFSVDGTQVEAWASMKSFLAKDGSGEPPSPGRNGERDFHGEQRSNETHASTTDPEARLYRKGSGQEAKLSYMGHAMMENRHGLVVGATLTPATGTAEREAAIKMIVRRSPGARRLTLGADKGYDTTDFVADMRELNIDSARGAEHDQPRLRHRRPHHAASWLCCQPDHSQADRGKLRLDQDDRRTAQNQTQGCGSRRVPVRLCNGSLQSDPDAQIALNRRLRPIICKKPTD